MSRIGQYKAAVAEWRDLGYRFPAFTDVFRDWESQNNAVADDAKPWLLLRYDIDLAPAYGVALAEANYDLGVAGTFFVQTDSAQYNTFDQINRAHLARIRELGQRIGLHYSAPEDESRWSTFLDDLEFAFEALRRCAGDCDRVVAWHNPTAAGRTVVAHMNELAARRVLCAYSPPFLGDGVAYVSDSLMRRTPDDIRSAIAPSASPRVQLCLHPIYWALPGDTVREVLLVNVHNRILHAAQEHDALPAWRETSDEFRALISPLADGKTRHGASK